jgi:hypothetical protein
MDRAVIGDLYRAECERMLVYFARRVYDAQLALDLVAETFARAYGSRDGVTGKAELRRNRATGMPGADFGCSCCFPTAAATRASYAADGPFAGSASTRTG